MMRNNLIALGLICSGLLAGCAGHQLHQTYYLGVFDPQEQLPQSLYRVRVKGNAPWFSNVNYAAGWVPAEFIDSLGSRVEFDRETGDVGFTGAEGAASKFKLTTGRRLMLFGPEGFREAPKDHRLVILMDSDPSKFFEAIEEALGQVSAAKTLTEGGELLQRKELQAEFQAILDERLELAELRTTVLNEEGER